LSGTTLDAATSGGIVGKPGSLPPGWGIVGGYLVGPQVSLKGVSLAGANLANVDLRGADLTFANLEGADLSNAKLDAANLGAAKFNGANVSGANFSNTTCPDGILSSQYSPETCVGHGID
jgi:Pentapeptide repeats (8 copies)